MELYNLGELATLVLLYLTLCYLKLVIYHRLIIYYSPPHKE